MARAVRCISEPIRLQKVAVALDRRFNSRCATSYCAAEKKHVAADLTEVRKYLKLGRCDDASIVLDHLEMIARRR
jgi:hypothetical protein